VVSDTARPEVNTRRSGACHAQVHPDCFDNTNYNFMFRLMPYYFGAGCCFVTGTNVMVRARAAFQACRFDENPHGHETQTLPQAAKKQMTQVLGGDSHRQLFSETLVAEDIDLGSRVHTLGYKCASTRPSCSPGVRVVHVEEGSGMHLMQSMHAWQHEVHGRVTFCKDAS
jgi:cellulose synthase/poly-beta-1,6-N-acetylglucosamine synthase-like glycosyltransferase